MTRRGSDYLSVVLGRKHSFLPRSFPAAAPPSAMVLLTTVVWAATALAPSPHPAFAAAGPYKVASASIKVPGLKAKGGSKEAKVYAPSTGGPFPFVSFLHGALDDNYVNLMQDVASYGFVVSNVQNCEPACDLGDFAADQLHMIDVAASATGASLLAKANTNRSGLLGHSFGGIATVINTNRVGNASDVKAAFHLHPCPCETIRVGAHECKDMQTLGFGLGVG